MSNYPCFEVNHGSGSGSGCKSSENDSGELGERGEQLAEWSTHSRTDLHVGVFWCFYSSREQLFQLLGFGALNMCLLYAIR
jgi:hypothetical protein